MTECGPALPSDASHATTTFKTTEPGINVVVPSTVRVENDLGGPLSTCDASSALNMPMMDEVGQFGRSLAEAEHSQAYVMHRIAPDLA